MTFGLKGNRTKSSVRNQPPLQAHAEKQKGMEADAPMDIQSKAMSDKDQSRVAE